MFGVASVLAAVLGLGLGFTATDAHAASSHHKRTHTAHVSGPFVASAYGHAWGAYPGVFPVRGYRDWCDLPSSGCPNDLRISN